MKKSHLITLVKEVLQDFYNSQGNTPVDWEKRDWELYEAFKKGKVIVYHNFQGVDVDENVPGTNKVLNVTDCIGNEPAKDYNYFTTEKKQYVEDMVKNASGEGWKKFTPVLAIPHPLVSGKYSIIDGNHRLGAFTIGKIPQINARILSDDKILLAEKGAEWDENKLPKTMSLADAKKKGVHLKEYFATQPLKVPSNENYVLQDLEDKFDIDLDLHDDGKAFTLSRIVIPKDKRGQGVGSKVMKLITQYADAQNKPIYLTPSKDFGATSTGRLEQFYKQFGFKKKDRSDFSTKETMVREPQTSENYADGKVKGKSRPGRVKKAGASCKGSVTDLRAKAKKYGGEKGKMYHWCANMKSGKK